MKQYKKVQSSSLFEVNEVVSTQAKEALSEYKQRLFAELEVQKSIQGFPVAGDKQIIDLSGPPIYCACPNPFINDLTTLNTETPHISTPMTKDVYAGKNDPIYFAHYYSTKVPPEAISQFIFYYSNPGDVVFDGFCGTGMTGVAAQLCGNDKLAVKFGGKKGNRKAILVDLSPAATFITAGTNSISKLRRQLDKVEKLIEKIEEDHEILFTTAHTGWARGEKSEKLRKNKKESLERGEIEYLIWSDIYTCSNCGQEIVHWDVVFNGPGEETNKELICGKCHAVYNANSVERSWETKFDKYLGTMITQAKQRPVLINYRIGTKRFEKYPDKEDLDIINALENGKNEEFPPVVELQDGYNTKQPKKSHGFTHVHHFFTKRNILLMSHFWHTVKEQEDYWLKLAGLYILTGAIQRICKLNRYMPNHDRHVGPLSGTLYVAPLTAELIATKYMKERIKDLKRCTQTLEGEDLRISTQSATALKNIKSETVDYIFTDPPFGGNLNYSELNVLVEAWLEIRTNTVTEAIVNETQKKELYEYQRLMEDSFKEFYRILKPGRWMTLEFSNSQNSVWVAIQEALLKAGFVVADVRILDKKKGTTKQLSYSATVKQDLIISSYKPDSTLEKGADLIDDSQEGIWNFVRHHLKHLASYVEKQGNLEIMSERQAYMLYERMVAYYITRGIMVPISTQEFYTGLMGKFIERDGMYFLPEQAAEYEKKRITVKEIVQLELFITDEASAIQWLKQQLGTKPQTFQELHPQFMKEVAGWNKNEKSLELGNT